MRSEGSWRPCCEIREKSSGRGKGNGKKIATMSSWFGDQVGIDMQVRPDFSHTCQA